jgi:hypothetical protein
VILRSLPGSTEEGGKERKALRSDLLALASPNLRSFWDHCYARHVRASKTQSLAMVGTHLGFLIVVYSDLSLFGVVPPLFRGLATLTSIVFSVMYMEEPKALDRALLVFASQLLLPLINVASKHTFALSESAAAGANTQRDLSQHASLYTHTLQHLSQEVLFLFPFSFDLLVFDCSWNV